MKLPAEKTAWAKSMCLATQSRPILRDPRGLQPARFPEFKTHGMLSVSRYIFWSKVEWCGDISRKKTLSQIAAS